MDCVDKALYDFDDEKYDNMPEATRRAFVNVFSPNSDDAVLIMKYLIGVTQWENEIVTNDPVLNSQAVALKGVMAGIKKQLNMKKIELGDANE
jgi:hypothetical protein